VLIWHVHGSWTEAFVSGPHSYLVTRSADGSARGLCGRDWPAAEEVGYEYLADRPVDLVVLQRPEELELTARWLRRRLTLAVGPPSELSPYERQFATISSDRASPEALSSIPRRHTTSGSHPPCYLRPYAPPLPCPALHHPTDENTFARTVYPQSHFHPQPGHDRFSAQ
jgi:hypothetical protein